MKHVEIWPRKTKHISVGSIKQVSNFFKNYRSRKLKHIEFWSRKLKRIYRFEQIHFSKTSAETVEKAGKSEFLVVKVKKYLCRVEQANFQSFINCRLRKLRKAKHIDIGQKIRNISMRCRTNKFFKQVFRFGKSSKSKRINWGRTNKLTIFQKLSVE